MRELKTNRVLSKLRPKVAKTRIEARYGTFQKHSHLKNPLSYILYILLLALPIFFSGCGLYNSNFQCPPGKGVGCASASEVFNMIEEQAPATSDPFDSGENLFVPKKNNRKSK